MLGDAGYGTFTINSSGYWTYKLNNNHPAVNGLNVGNQLQDWTTFLLETDSHRDPTKPDVIVSDTLEITVVVSIEGSDDLSLINNEVTKKFITINENQYQEDAVITSTGYNKSAHGGFIVILDVDDNIQWVEPTSSSNTKNYEGVYGTLTMMKNGIWYYNLKSQALFDKKGQNLGSESYLMEKFVVTPYYGSGGNFSVNDKLHSHL